MLGEMKRSHQAGVSAPKLVGGRLCLDFVNTVDPRHATPREEHLSNYAAVVGWAQHAGIIASDEASRLVAGARRRPAAARRAHQGAIVLRETLYTIFGAVARGQACSPRSMRRFNEQLAHALRKRQIMTEGSGFAWRWTRDHSLDRVLSPVIWSAAELLTRGPLPRVHECPGDDNCGWLFLDTTKSGSRRWCDMRTCGNRAKARRYYRRTALS
jgi:predicted RNA-binding Zn ribbon-like protein